MKYGIWGVGEAHVGDTVLLAVHELGLRARMDVVDVDRVIIAGGDQQVLRAVEGEGVYASLVVLSSTEPQSWPLALSACMRSAVYEAP